MKYQILKSYYYTTDVYDMLVTYPRGVYINKDIKYNIPDLLKLDLTFDFKYVTNLSQLKDFKLIAGADTIEELKGKVIEYII